MAVQVESIGGAFRFQREGKVVYVQQRLFHWHRGSGCWRTSARVLHRIWQVLAIPTFPCGRQLMAEGIFDVQHPQLDDRLCICTPLPRK